ncbi:MAG: hypothetical protein HYS98_09000 [Deltaproteobacteria bacterium]|nr:hypothetical protein [Deltaproteobacteria bacterium]
MKYKLLHFDPIKRKELSTLVDELSKSKPIIEARHFEGERAPVESKNEF